MKNPILFLLSVCLLLTLSASSLPLKVINDPQISDNPSQYSGINNSSFNTAIDRSNKIQDSQMVVFVVTTPGNEHDGEVFAEVLDKRAGAVTADKIYDQKRSHKLLEEKKIADRIISNTRGNVAGGVQEVSLNRERGVVERVNAWLKRWCGGGPARYWGLARVSVQMLLAATAVNLKRWVCLAYLEKT